MGTLGTNTTMLESLLLKRKIMGPTWVMLQGAARVPAANQVSWCKLEVALGSPKQLLAKTPAGGLPTAPPPLIVAALSLKTVLTGGAKSTNQIVAASCVHQACDLSSAAPLEAWRGGQGMRHFTLVRRLEGQTWPIGAHGHRRFLYTWMWLASGIVLLVLFHAVSSCHRLCCFDWVYHAALCAYMSAGFEELLRSENSSAQGQRNGGSMLQAQVNERALLSCLLAQLQKLDADVLVGHNIAAFHLDVLLHRMQHCKVSALHALIAHIDCT